MRFEEEWVSSSGAVVSGRTFVFRMTPSNPQVLGFMRTSRNSPSFMSSQETIMVSGVFIYSTLCDLPYPAYPQESGERRRSRARSDISVSVGSRDGGP